MIKITNEQNRNVIGYDYDYIVSNHDYSRDYICLETSSECKKNICMVWCKYIFTKHMIWMNAMKTLLIICKDQAPEKKHI